MKRRTKNDCNCNCYADFVCVGGGGSAFFVEEKKGCKKRRLVLCGMFLRLHRKLFRRRVIFSNDV